MSLQVCAAGSSSVPCPSRLTPTSLITMLAPSRAMHSANSRPMPRPDPVTTATRPSRIPIGCSAPRLRVVLVASPAQRGYCSTAAVAVPVSFTSPSWFAADSSSSTEPAVAVGRLAPGDRAP